MCVREFTFERKDLGGMLTEGLITVASKKTVSKGLFVNQCSDPPFSMESTKSERLGHVCD